MKSVLLRQGLLAAKKDSFPSSDPFNRNPMRSMTRVAENNFDALHLVPRYRFWLCDVLLLTSYVEWASAKMLHEVAVEISPFATCLRNCVSDQSNTFQSLGATPTHFPFVTPSRVAHVKKGESVSFSDILHGVIQDEWIRSNFLSSRVIVSDPGKFQAH